MADPRDDDLEAEMMDIINATLNIVPMLIMTSRKTTGVNTWISIILSRKLFMKIIPRDDRYYSEVIAVSLAKLFQSLCKQINGPNIFLLFGSCWEKVCQEHHMKRKVPLKVVLYKVSTIYLP